MTTNIHDKPLLILDFGSQYTQLIARRIREAGVYCEIHAYEHADKVIAKFQPAGIILSGGPETVTNTETPRIPELVFDYGVPVLGICYGMQAMAEQLGGSVESSDKREFGYARVQVSGSCTLLDGIEDHLGENGNGLLDVWMSHGDKVTELPAGFQISASTDSAPIAAIADDSRNFYGVQFHPEVTHTLQGQRIISRFVHEICGCESNWSPATIIEDAVQKIRNTVGTDTVILGLSGGVDSSVVAMLMNRAIGDQLVCVFVDNGLLRLDEGDQVMRMFDQHLGLHVIRVDAERRFLHNLLGVADPEEKRKIIGNTFIEVFDEESAKIENAVWLAQGTIYPDVIESAGSATGKAHVIKSHHNVGGLPEDMKLKLVEPLRELFKDEVRKVGLELGLAYDMLYRHPFPGPGLGVRILGEVRKVYADILRQADAIFIEELHAADYYHKTSQAFAVFLPVKSVGVVGDARRYEYVIALRAVETIDFMTARWAHLPYDLLEKVSNRIINEIEKVARVTYDISSKPPATIEWE
ncbi:MAG: glutamine-hydrolyzing GMP synthase [Pseudomonadales bacterium]|nr:glutamine-hydrolyzing GMP synthase [Pseudomonadales bacterium]